MHRGVVIRAEGDLIDIPCATIQSCSSEDLNVLGWEYRHEHSTVRNQNNRVMVTAGVGPLWCVQTRDQTSMKGGAQRSHLF